MYAIGVSRFERIWTLRFMDEHLIDFIVNKEFAIHLLEKITVF